MEADTRPSRLKEVEKLLDEGLLSNDQKEKLQSLNIRVAKAANLRISTCYDTIISALKSHDWYEQNPAVNLIAANDRSEIAVLSPAQQEELGRNILQAADGSSRSALAYLSAVHTDPSDLEQPFLRGLIFEAFVNEKLEFRFKEEYMAVVLDLLANQKDIEAELVEAIDASKRKNWIFGSDYRRTLDLVKERPDIKLLGEALERNRERLMVIDDF
jgi:hypothetical protein